LLVNPLPTLGQDLSLAQGQALRQEELRRYRVRILSISGVYHGGAHFQACKTDNFFRDGGQGFVWDFNYQSFLLDEIE